MLPWALISGRRRPWTLPGGEQTRGGQQHGNGSMERCGTRDRTWFTRAGALLRTVMTMATDARRAAWCGEVVLQQGSGGVFVDGRW